MTTATVRSGGRAGTTDGRAVALVVLAVGQVVSAALVAAFGGAFVTADRSGEPPVTPAGWAFSIWSLVEVLSLAYAIWAVHSRAPGAGLRTRLATPLIVVFAGFSAWLAAEEIEPTWATLVVFLVMEAALLRAVAVLCAGRAELATWPRPARVLVGLLVGVYTGWSSIAIWVNLTTAFAGSGAPITGVVGVLAQLAVLAGATATAVVLVRRTRVVPVLAISLAAAVVWALLAAAVGAGSAGQPVLALAAAAGLVVVAGVAGTSLRAGR